MLRGIDVASAMHQANPAASATPLASAGELNALFKKQIPQRRSTYRRQFRMCGLQKDSAGRFSVKRAPTRRGVNSLLQALQRDNAFIVGSGDSAARGNNQKFVVVPDPIDETLEHAHFALHFFKFPVAGFGPSFGTFSKLPSGSIPISMNVILR